VSSDWELLNIRGHPCYASLPENSHRAESWMSCFYKKNWMDKTQKRRLCQSFSVILCCLFWISWLSKKGLIGCPKMPVINCQSMLHNITEQCRSHTLIWWCRPWFGYAWSNSEWSGLMQSGSALHTQTYDDLTYLSTKFQAITSSCIQVNMITGQLIQKLSMRHTDRIRIS